MNMRFVLVFFFLYDSILLAAEAYYDPLDPNGNIRVKWDVISWTHDGYVATVTMFNFQQYRHIQAPGWTLGWTWAHKEVIWDMRGAQTTEQGDCSNYKSPGPHCCKKDPTVVDLLPGTPYNQQVANCCKGGVLNSLVQDPSTAASSFQISVGTAGTTNETIKVPNNFTLKAPGPGGYTCGPAKIVEPTTFFTADGRRATQAMMTWNLTCTTYSQFLAQKTPTCCVSLSAFYNENIVPCPTCTCGCQNNDTHPGSCVNPKSPYPASVVSSSNKNDYTPLVQCTHHMCPIRVHWHIKLNHKDYWRVEVRIINFNYRMGYAQWNMVVQHPNFDNLTQIFNLNYKPLNPYAGINDTAMLYGVMYYNDFLSQAGPLGNVQSDLLFRKDPSTFTFESGWAFPRKIYFNGDECVIPPPPPFLPNTSSRQQISLLTPIILLFLSLCFLPLHCACHDQYLVGSYFAKQYYHVLQQKPDCAHQFYTASSSVIRVDGESSEKASEILRIHTLIMSLNFTAIEIQTINSLDSWNGGVLVVVSGSVKAKEFTGRRKFVQSFLLAPQEKGFFVLNDIFQLLSEEVVYQHSTPVLQENIVDYQQPTPAYLDDRVDYQHSAPLYADNNVDYQHSAPTYSENLSDYQHHPGQMLHDDRDYQHQAPVYADNIADSHPTNHSPLSESPDVPSYEVKASEHLNSVHIEGNGHVDDYSSYEQHQQEEPVVEYAKAAPVEDLTASHNVVNHQQESLPAAEEPIVETQKFSYASILRASTGKPAPSIVVHGYPKKTPPPVSEWDSIPQSNSQPSYLPDSSAEVVEESFSHEGESKSVYVKNLPPTVSTIDIQQEFENFGRIKPDGVFIKNRKEYGVCFAFVEFEDVESVQNAIKASPIQLVGRQVYIEERRPSTISSSNMPRGGGRRGRGRGSYSNDERGRFGGRSLGRGNTSRGSY